MRSVLCECFWGLHCSSLTNTLRVSSLETQFRYLGAFPMFPFSSLPGIYCAHFLIHLNCMISLFFDLVHKLQSSNFLGKNIFYIPPCDVLRFGTFLAICDGVGRRPMAPSQRFSHFGPARPLNPPGGYVLGTTALCLPSAVSPIAGVCPPRPPIDI